MPHITFRVAPFHHDSTRRAATTDIVERSVPTNPCPSDCMAASTRTGYLINENQSSIQVEDANQKTRHGKTMENQNATLPMFIRRVLAIGSMIDKLPPEVGDPLPPIRIALIARHDDGQRLEHAVHVLVLVPPAGAAARAGSP